MTPQTNIPYRLQRVEQQQEKGLERLGAVEDLAMQHDVELHGERGVFKALDALNRRLGWINAAMWTLVVAIIGASIAIVAALA